MNGSIHPLSVTFPSQTKKPLCVDDSGRREGWVCFAPHTEESYSNRNEAELVSQRLGKRGERAREGRGREKREQAARLCLIYSIILLPADKVQTRVLESIGSIIIIIRFIATFTCLREKPQADEQCLLSEG